MSLAGYLNLQKQHLMDLKDSAQGTDNEVNGSLNSIQAKLNGVADKYASTGITNRDILTHQNEIADMVSQETERLASKKSNIDTALEGQQRMTMLNDSYRQKYSFYLKLVLTVLTLTILYIIINFLSSKMPMIPGPVWDLILIIIFSVGFIYLYYVYMDMSRRDSMNFNKLYFAVPDPNKVTDTAKLLSGTASKTSLADALSSFTGACRGADCCVGDNLTYDEGSKVCVPASSFANMSDNDNDLVKPSEPDEFNNYGKY